MRGCVLSVRVCWGKRCSRDVCVVLGLWPGTAVQPLMIRKEPRPRTGGKENLYEW